MVQIIMYYEVVRITEKEKGESLISIVPSPCLHTQWIRDWCQKKVLEILKTHRSVQSCQPHGRHGNRSVVFSVCSPCSVDHSDLIRLWLHASKKINVKNTTLTEMQSRNPSGIIK